PPEHEKVINVLKGVKKMGWIISIDVNLRPKLAANLAQYVAAVQATVPLADWLKASDEDLALLGFTSPKRSQGADIAKHFTALARHQPRRADVWWRWRLAASRWQIRRARRAQSHRGRHRRRWRYVLGQLLGRLGAKSRKCRQSRPDHPVSSHASRRHQLHKSRLPATKVF
ncbi:MAG: 2-dehydro-3-deoxygluconokinase, partial [Pseudomonadota bacterium]